MHSLCEISGLGPSGQGLLPELDKPTGRWQERFDELVAEVEQVANLVSGVFGGQLTSPQGLLDISNMFTHIPTPISVEHYVDDTYFGRQRLAGANPLVIKRVQKIEDLKETAFKDEHIVEVIGVKLEPAIDEGRIFICDYEILADFTELSGMGLSSAIPEINPIIPAAVKYFEAPIALFYWEGSGTNGQMRPVGIQIERRVNADVITPKHPKLWPIAKLAVQSADAQIHELDSHAMRCHFVLEAVKVAAERTFHTDHPVLILLRPHLRMLLAINDQVDAFLFNEGDNIDQLLAPPLVEGSHGILEVARRSYDFKVLADWDEEVRTRQMSKDDDDAQDVNVDYPYRDDGKLLWDAITNFTLAYVEHYYQDDQLIIDDIELQNFTSELSGEGRIDGVDRIQDIKSLAKMLTRIIWSSGPLHAALNFSQWDHFGFVANAPFSMFQEFPTGDNPHFPFDNFLPNLHASFRQTGLMYALSSLKYDILGYYEPKDFDTDNDPDLEEIIHEFQCALGQINAEIFRRNLDRAVPYPYLMPIHVPNSTSV
ncbi:lipoxygenase family protein [Fuerstiella marisgermanici]|uniref:Oleic acid lipoxygenase n=1 Tax=Fuerstiella marisgermanici TaxID=1891926 RepID=A0A1P8WRB1_9PLAN|nr:lipoxygenase family protein [Fuerstiella marisgermanici]APZ96585.1 Oleic acid lipoxygenase precursor [Fuerstiella marisgermanici]